MSAALTVLLAIPASADAQDMGMGLTTPPPEPSDKQGIDILIEGWDTFANGWLLLDMVIVLVLALLLGAVIGYHPSTRRRVSTLEHFEQPKTFLMYSMVAAVVALLVKVQPAMAFVIFGIGGLLRFRTMVGEAKDTGRVILVTVVGLCCGLKIFIVAIPATVIGWIIIYVLEQQLAGIIRVTGVSDDHMQDAAKAFRAKITGAGCTIIGEQTKYVKREFLFVIKAPHTLDREALDAAFDDFPKEHQGAVAWEHM
jgi:hypothetical protein